MVLAPASTTPLLAFFSLSIKLMMKSLVLFDIYNTLARVSVNSFEVARSLAPALLSTSMPAACRLPRTKLRAERKNLVPSVLRGQLILRCRTSQLRLPHQCADVQHKTHSQEQSHETEDATTRSNLLIFFKIQVDNYLPCELELHPNLSAQT